MIKKYIDINQSFPGEPKFVEKEAKKSNKQNSNLQLANATGIGLSIAIPIAGGGLLGSYLDKIFLTSPWLSLIFLFLGIVVGLSSLILIVYKLGKKV